MNRYPIQYFAYGAMALEGGAVLEALLGRKPHKRASSPRLLNFRLVTQRLEHIPDCVIRAAPTSISPRAMLQAVWPPNFRSYTVVPCKGSSVRGEVFEIDERERRLLLEYELVPWGWQVAMNHLPADGGGIWYCTTEVLRPGQRYDHFFKVGTEYPPLPVADLNKTLEVATRVGREFRAHN